MQANSLTNAVVIERLPESRRPAALALMERFITAFNTCLPLIPNLYECQENPYLMPDGRVDLSGTKKDAQPMGPDTPISFSLPSIIQVRRLTPVPLVRLFLSWW
jgi:hypothetical protein